MRCHQCQKVVAPNSAICPHCDAILDETLFEEEYGDEAYDDEYADGAYDDGAYPEEGYDTYEPASASYVEEPPPAGAPPPAESTRILQLDPERQKETRIVQLSDIKGKGGSAAAAAAARRKAAEQAKDEDVAEIWGQVRVAWRRLRTIDKIVQVGLLLLFVGAFLPWASVRGKGAISGIEMNGVWTVLFAVGAIAAFWARITLRIGLLVLVQIAFTLGAAVFPGLLLRGTAPGVVLAGGVYLCLTGGLVAAVAALIGAAKT